MSVAGGRGGDGGFGGECLTIIRIFSLIGLSVIMEHSM